MNYKIISFVLAAGLAGAVVYIVKLKQDTVAQFTATNLAPELYVDEELYNYWLAQDTLHRDSTGKFIDKSMATEIFKGYHTWSPKPLPHGGPNGQPYAFSIGTNVMQKLLNNIEYINDSIVAGGGTNTIEAIRVYLARKKTNGKKHLDILIMPALKDTRSYVQLDTTLMLPPKRLRTKDDSTMINTSAPCPNYCQ
jgi:hypothetical protein